METYTVLFKEGETTGVYGISLVNDPAMKGIFIALSKEQIQLKAIDTEKRIVMGAVLIPNKPVYRNQNGKEFNIVFPCETIRLASEGFLKNGHQSSSTLEHDIDTKLSGVTIVESWIKENDVNDKSVHYGLNEPIGTWFASMKIDNDEIWNDYVKTGKVKGFSIDGFFDLEKVNLKSELNMSEQKSFIDEVKQIIKEGFTSLTLKKEEVKINLGSVNTADGTVKFNFEGDTVAAGLNLTMTAPDGTELPVPDGEYDLEGGMHITVSGSVVQEVSTAKEEPTDEPAPATPMSTDAPQVKSEKVTSEVFYQLSKEDSNAIILEFGSQLEKAKTELRAEFETKMSKETEAVQLTKNKPAKESNEPLTAFQKFRKFNNKFN
jgi:hypothetical protein